MGWDNFMKNKKEISVEVKKFTRKKENFTCENCGKNVVGTGYTNHCPSCFFSKHVDINPGDRMSECHGMMEPIGIETEKGTDYVMLKCQKCGHKKRNKLAKNDDLGVLLSIIKEKGDLDYK